jgi:hypothetical protein
MALRNKHGKKRLLGSSRTSGNNYVRWVAFKSVKEGIEKCMEGID